MCLNSLFAKLNRKIVGVGSKEETFFGIKGFRTQIIGADNGNMMNFIEVHVLPCIYLVFNGLENTMI